VSKAKKTTPTTLEVRHPSHEKGELQYVGGSRSDAFNNVLIRQALNSLWLTHAKSAEDKSKLYGAAAAALVGIGPKDELEGMLAAQMIASHNAAMECYRRAMIGEQTFEGRRESLSQANKLSRTYATLLEALNRHRGKGQQKVTVEHVHVHSGGQAIVGAVEQPGGGVASENEGQPHAEAISNAPQPPLWSEDAKREPLPVRGHAERPLPDARRKVAGRTEGKGKR
jgi:hypothetical protein